MIAFSFLVLLVFLLQVSLHYLVDEPLEDKGFYVDGEANSEPIENDHTSLDSSPEKNQLTALDQVLQIDWPDEDQWISANQAAPKTREDFVQASQKKHDAREMLLERNYPAALDEEGRYIVLNNNRFFSIDTDADAEYGTRDLYLHYEELKADVEKPVIRLMPSFAGRSRNTSSSHAVKNIAEQEKDKVAFEILDGAIILPLGTLGVESDAWVIHVDPVNALGLSARRYLVFLD